MVLFPNCKINLGLRVTGKRPDGYHNLETIFYPLPLSDAAELNITHSPGVSGLRADNFELILTGIPIAGESGDNLCRKAWELIRKNHSEQFFQRNILLKMHLHKAIPVGAGLGGGSSDGAYTLLLLNKMLDLQLSDTQLKNYALQLGSDCPFFILNKPCLATGRGEIMEEITIGLDDYYFVLVAPDIHISTGWAFSQVNNTNNMMSLQEIIRSPVEQWKELLVNDFEKPVFATHPSLKEIKQILYDAGAAYASMSGSGSCMYGIFHKNSKAGKMPLHPSYNVYTLKQHY